jgi:hypothetical protein
MARDRWVFIVRKVRSREALVGRTDWDGTIGGFFGFLLVKTVEELVAKRSPYMTVAVLSYRNRRIGGRIRVVHKEKRLGVEKAEVRFAALVERVNEGFFDR